MHVCVHVCVRVHVCAFVRVCVGVPLCCWPQRVFCPQIVSQQMVRNSDCEMTSLTLVLTGQHCDGGVTSGCGNGLEVGIDCKKRFALPVEGWCYVTAKMLVPWDCEMTILCDNGMTVLCGP